mgnify:CR=1 FL=1
MARLSEEEFQGLLKKAKTRWHPAPPDLGEDSPAGPAHTIREVVLVDLTFPAEVVAMDRRRRQKPIMKAFGFLGSGIITNAEYAMNRDKPAALANLYRARTENALALMEECARRDLRLTGILHEDDTNARSKTWKLVRLLPC